MITKERLEELIEQGDTIYGIDDRWDIVEVRDLDAKQIYCSSSNDNYQYVFDDHSVIEFFEDDLFETKEDAEEYEEFGNITRTERLELPTWASIEKDFDKFKNGSYVLAERDEFSLELKISKPLISQIIIYTEDDDYNWNLSRQNYNEARRLCVKLFKGEE